MTGRTRNKKETFIDKAFREFRENVVRGFALANNVRRKIASFVKRFFESVGKFLYKKNKWSIVVALMVISGLLGLIWPLWPIRGLNCLFGIILGIIGGFLYSFSIFVNIIFAIFFLRILAMLIPYLLSILWAIIYALKQIVIVLAKFLFLIPLTIFIILNHLIHLQKKIYHTCPYCSYRGLPIYVCPDCGEFNEKLWPNLYGLLHHDCTDCGRTLPTLDILGRNKMEQRCDHCEMPILSKNTVPLPEKLVAIVGGHRSGKTSYLIMAVDEVTNGNNEDETRIKGEIEIETQKEKFGQKLNKLSEGIALEKNEDINEPFLLYAEVNARKCLIYLYDTPGGKFATFSSMSEKHYFTLLEGLVLLVDPLSFKSVRVGFNGLDYQPTPLQDVVNSILHAASSGIPLGKSGKFKMHVAVVISKADMECVSEKIEKIGDKLTETACRDAIMEWGGESAIRSIELRFENVEYFACSPLGRDGDPDNKDPFRGYGILEPLDWVLSDGDN